MKEWFFFNTLWAIFVPFVDFTNIWPDSWVNFLYFWTKIYKTGHSVLVKRIDKGNASFSILWPRFTKFDNCSVLHMSFGGHENHRGRANSVLFSLEHGQSCAKLDKYCPTKDSQSPIWTFSFSYVLKDRHALRK